MLAMAVSGIIKHSEFQACSDNCITSCENTKTLKKHLCHEQILCNNSTLSALLLFVVSMKEVAEVALIPNEAVFMVSLITIYFQ